MRLTLTSLRAQWRSGTENDRKECLAHAVSELPGLAVETPLSEVLWVDNSSAEADARAVLSAADDTTAVQLLVGRTREKGSPLACESAWTHAPAPRPWLIPGWLPAARLGVLVGEGALGKSRLALQLARAVAAGVEGWLPGGPTLAAAGKPAPAVLATWEDEIPEISDRLGAPEGTLDLHDRLHALSYIGCGPVWAPGASRSGPRHRADWTDVGNWIRAFCESIGARLLIIDPLAAAYAGDENSRSEVREFLSAFDAWAYAARVTVLLIGHPPKSDSPYSGTTDWHAAARAMWTLSMERVSGGRGAGRDAKAAPKLTNFKQSYAPSGAGLWLAGYPSWSVADEAVAAQRWATRSDTAVTRGISDLTNSDGAV